MCECRGRPVCLPKRCNARQYMFGCICYPVQPQNHYQWKWARIAPCPFVVIRSEILLYKYHWQHLLLAAHTARTAPALRVTYCCKCYRSFGDYFTKTFASRKCFTFGNVWLSKLINHYSHLTSTATLRVNCFAFVAKHQASLCFTHLTSTFLPLTM